RNPYPSGSEAALEWVPGEEQQALLELFNRLRVRPGARRDRRRSLLTLAATVRSMVMLRSRMRAVRDQSRSQEHASAPWCERCAVRISTSPRCSGRSWRHRRCGANERWRKCPEPRPDADSCRRTRVRYSSLHPPASLEPQVGIEFGRADIAGFVGLVLGC